MDDFLHHMLRLGDFAWELRNHRLEQLLREPLSAAAWVHRWLTAAEGDHHPSPPRPDKDSVASLRVVNGTLECPPQEGPTRVPETPAQRYAAIPIERMAAGHPAEIHRDPRGGT